MGFKDSRRSPSTSAASSKSAFGDPEIGPSWSTPDSWWPSTSPIPTAVVVVDMPNKSVTRGRRADRRRRPR